MRCFFIVLKGVIFFFNLDKLVFLAFLNPILFKVILISPLKLLDLMPSQIQKRMEDMAGACLDTTALDDESFNMEATQDRCILRLIASCCNGELV